jgi:hypothetical protein
MQIPTLKKSDPMFPSGRPSDASGCPSVLRSFWTVQGCIRPDVMATHPDALQSSRRFQLSFVDTEWEDSLHPSEQPGNTVRTPRSLIRKLHAYILHQPKLQGKTIWMLSLIRQLRVDKLQSSEHDLNIETRKVRYGKVVAQLTVRTHNASVQTPPREVRDKLDLSLLSL